ncbi:hypothetical protein V9T40_011375 [Parthenolecanium corni]|uniref:CHK kinase-like domain-containing protein n=1 Tax=Parthenolecanium corni TaxID=536013 RepID=A0AAN9XYJ1_9HEMI
MSEKRSYSTPRLLEQSVAPHRVHIIEHFRPEERHTHFGPQSLQVHEMTLRIEAGAGGLRDGIALNGSEDTVVKDVLIWKVTIKEASQRNGCNDFLGVSWKERKLSESEDLKAAVNQFIKNYEATYSVKITSCRVDDDVVKAGDNMLSGITRLNFDYKEHRKSKSGRAILKIPSLAALPYEQLRKTNMFDREVHFYETLLPRLYELGQCKPFAPKLYAVTEAKALVLEDLSVDRYTPGNRLDQLDLDQSRISLNMLATYHALGYKYLQTLSKDDSSWSLIGSVQPTLVGRPKTESFNKFLTMIKPHLTPALYDKMKGLEAETLANPKIKEPESMTVIIHGDYRTNNILFKYVDNEVREVKIIDWQLSKEANPALDLIYFFVTSVPIKTVESHDDELLNLYLETLNDKLGSLETGRSYSKQELDEDIKYYKSYFLKTICINWQEIMRAGKPGEETDKYISSAAKWLDYLERKEII